MTTFTLYPTPPLRAVALAQLRAVGLALRKLGVIYLLWLGLNVTLSVCAAYIATRPSTVQPQRSVTTHGDTLVTRITTRTTRILHKSWGDVRLTKEATSSVTHVRDGMATKTDTSVTAWHIGTVDWHFVPPGTFIVLLAGLVLPFSVWRSEDPARRAYHWTMPVGRVPHTLLKVLAGWTWLMVVPVTSVLFAAATLQMNKQYGYGYLDQDHMWQWAIPFVTGTLIYLFTSLVVVAAEHPWRWIAGGTVAYAVALGVGGSDTTTLARVHHGFVQLFFGTYGLFTALFGRTFETFVHELESIFSVVPESALDPLVWLKAALLWVSIAGIAMVCAAAYRKKDLS